MGKLTSDQQRGEHVYLIIETLNNKIKGLKLEKIKFENFGKKNPQNLTLTGETPHYKHNLINSESTSILYEQHEHYNIYMMNMYIYEGSVDKLSKWRFLSGNR